MQELTNERKMKIINGLEDSIVSKWTPEQFDEFKKDFTIEELIFLEWCLDTLMNDIAEK